MTNLYSVTYNTNNSTGGTTPATQTAESDATTYTFTAPEQNDLVRTGYGLAGWSEDPSATSPEYNLGETITLSNTSPSKILYAVWQPGLQLINTMQEITAAGCSDGTNIGDTKQLIDTRKNADGNTRTYWVAKLSDGRCWMTQNLDYDDPNSTRRTGDTKPDNWPNENTTRQYWDPGEKIISGSTLAAANDSTDKHLLIGNYYSWASATNGTGNNITSTTSSDYPIEASDSICPDGWRLPTGRPTSGDFHALNNIYPKGTSSSNPGWNSTNKGTWFGGANEASGGAFFPAGGRVYSGSLNNAGSNGFYWSSAAYNAASAYNSSFYSSNVNPSDGNNRYYGFSVRCVVR